MQNGEGDVPASKEVTLGKMSGWEEREGDAAAHFTSRGLERKTGVKAKGSFKGEI